MNLETSLTPERLINSERAKEIAREIGSSFQKLLTEVQELREKNQILNEGLGMFRTTDALHNFQFQCFDKSSGGLGKVELFNRDGKTVLEGPDGYIESNKEYISRNELNQIKNEFENRKAEILSRLSKEFQAPQEAKDEIKDIHTDLILKPLNDEPLFELK